MSSNAFFVNLRIGYVNYPFDGTGGICVLDWRWAKNLYFLLRFLWKLTWSACLWNVSFVSLRSWFRLIEKTEYLLSSCFQVLFLQESWSVHLPQMMIRTAMINKAWIPVMKNRLTSVNWFLRPRILLLPQLFWPIMFPFLHYKMNSCVIIMAGILLPFLPLQLNLVLKTYFVRFKHLI